MSRCRPRAGPASTQKSRYHSNAASRTVGETSTKHAAVQKKAGWERKSASVFSWGGAPATGFSPRAMAAANQKAPARVDRCTCPASSAGAARLRGSCVLHRAASVGVGATRRQYPLPRCSSLILAHQGLRCPPRGSATSSSSGRLRSASFPYTMRHQHATNACVSLLGSAWRVWDSELCDCDATLWCRCW